MDRDALHSADKRMRYKHRYTRTRARRNYGGRLKCSIFRPDPLTPFFLLSLLPFAFACANGGTPLLPDFHFVVAAAVEVLPAPSRLIFVRRMGTDEAPLSRWADIVAVWIVIDLMCAR